MNRAIPGVENYCIYFPIYDAIDNSLITLNPTVTAGRIDHALINNILDRHLTKMFQKVNTKPQSNSHSINK